MAGFSGNVTILLPAHVGSLLATSAQQISLYEAIHHLYIFTNDLFQSRTPIVLSFFAVVWICWSIVFYFRYILYKYLLECYKLKELKPIDTLTFLVAFIEQLSTTKNERTIGARD